MPVLATEEWITAPLKVVRKLHAAAEPGEDAAQRVVEHFTQLLDSEEAWTKVPCLNVTPLEELVDGSLVRYRAMVQDQFDPELYLKYYTAVNSDTGHQLKCCGMYRDLLDIPRGCTVDAEGPDNVTGDRHTLYCVPIPAQTEWTRNVSTAPVYGQCSVVNSRREERGEQRAQGKRQLEEDGEEGGEGEMEVVEEGGGRGPKRAREEGSSEGGGANGERRSGGMPDLNFPLPDATGLPCLLKVYGEGVEVFRVTSAVECVGVLSKHPVLTHFEGDGEEVEGVGETAAERSAHCPPPSLVPRLHCILITSLGVTNPLLPRQLPLPLSGEVYRSKFGGVAESRDLVLSLLTSALLGDGLAAEFSLLHLLSSVHGRSEVLALGKFPLNITNCPPTSPPPPPPLQPATSFPSSLHTLLSQLLTQSLLLPLSISVMNTWRLTPRKNYSSNRLEAGALQLVPGTHLLVDETALEPGQLSEVGVRNLAALGHVIQHQTVTYDFQFHTTEFECDLPVMVLTEGKKSIIKVDCVLPLSPSPSSSLSPTPTEDQLNEARVYLSLHRILQYRLPPDVQKAVEEDFVSMRKTDTSMTADKFHHLLCLARLVCLSYGCSELTLLHWNYTKELETQRMARLQSTPPAA